MVEKRTIDGLGGKVLVTGIGKVDEDEFMLNLLNEQVSHSFLIAHQQLKQAYRNHLIELFYAVRQSIWSSVLLATTDSAQAKKQFLSRTARYSGLLNILGFADWDYTSIDQVSKLLDGANSWLAFNVSRSDIVPFCEKAVSAGVKRVVLTTELSPASINDTSLPEFQAAIKLFEQSGGSFTGIRHGSVVPGTEDNPYEIVNSTIPVLQPTVERGVLARVVAELLLLSKSTNQECGIGSSGSFAAAYLDVLRSTGLTRSQEIEKIFSGGIQRVARLTADSYEREKNWAQEEKEKKEKLRVSRFLFLIKPIHSHFSLIVFITHSWSEKPKRKRSAARTAARQSSRSRSSTDSSTKSPWKACSPTRRSSRSAPRKF